MKIFIISLLILLTSKFANSQNMDGMYMHAYIVIADTSNEYYELHPKMFKLSAYLNFEVDTLGRGFDKSQAMILYPENFSNPLFAGKYFPKRYPSDELSLEYIKYYQTGEEEYGGTIGIVVSITDDKDKAENILHKVQELGNEAFIVETELYMGCLAE